MRYIIIPLISILIIRYLIYPYIKNTINSIKDIYLNFNNKDNVSLKDSTVDWFAIHLLILIAIIVISLFYISIKFW